MATKPIGIYHEHPDWFRPLFQELDRRGADVHLGLPERERGARRVLRHGHAPHAVDLERRAYGRDPPQRLADVFGRLAALGAVGAR